MAKGIYRSYEEMINRAYGTYCEMNYYSEMAKFEDSEEIQSAFEMAEKELGERVEAIGKKYGKSWVEVTSDIMALEA